MSIESCPRVFGDPPQEEEPYGDGVTEGTVLAEVEELGNTADVNEQGKLDGQQVDELCDNEPLTAPL